MWLSISNHHTWPLFGIYGLFFLSSHYHHLQLHPQPFRPKIHNLDTLAIWGKCVFKNLSN